MSHCWRNVGEARRGLAQWLERWQAKYLPLGAWAEEETLTFYRLPRQHRKHMKSTDEIDKGFFRQRFLELASL